MLLVQSKKTSKKSKKQNYHVFSTSGNCKAEISFPPKNQYCNFTFMKHSLVCFRRVAWCRPGCCEMSRKVRLELNFSKRWSCARSPRRRWMKFSETYFRNSRHVGALQLLQRVLHGRRFLASRRIASHFDERFQMPFRHQSLRRVL